MTIEEIMKSGKLPKLYRVVKVEMSVLRAAIGYGGGVMFDQDTIVEKKVRRVLCSNGWKRSLVSEGYYDYCFESDSECLDEINAELGLI